MLRTLQRKFWGSILARRMAASCMTVKKCSYPWILQGSLELQFLCSYAIHYNSLFSYAHKSPKRVLLNGYFPCWEPNPISNEVHFVIVFKGAQFGSQPKGNLKEQVTSLNQRGQTQTRVLFYIPCFPDGFSPVKSRQTPKLLSFEILVCIVSILPCLKLAIN